MQVHALGQTVEGCNRWTPVEIPRLCGCKVCQVWEGAGDTKPGVCRGVLIGCLWPPACGIVRVGLYNRPSHWCLVQGGPLQAAFPAMLLCMAPSPHAQPPSDATQPMPAPLPDDSSGTSGSVEIGVQGEMCGIGWTQACVWYLSLLGTSCASSSMEVQLAA